MKIKAMIATLIGNFMDNKETQTISNLMTFAHVNKSRDELCRLAFTDKLTDVYNRNMLEEFREKFDTMDLFVTIIDIDKLKQVNDIKGHHEGDIFIKEIANKIKTYSDWVFRLGGDEFLVLNMRSIIVDIPSTSFGMVFKSSNIPLHEAMQSADFLMYENKKRKDHTT